MTLTFNSEAYASLLARYKPKVIKTDQENEEAIALAEEIAHRENRTDEESALFELLLTLIEKYEEERYPMGNSTPHSMLIHLMEVRDLKQTDLIKIFGSSEVTSEIISGQREISEAQSKALGEFFHVDPEFFVH